MPWPIDPRDRPAKIVRVEDLQGGTSGFTTRDGGSTGRSPLQFFDRDKVPPFEGPVAWFAVERVRGGSRIIKVLHQVEPPPGADLASAAAESAPYVPWSTPGRGR